MNRLSRRRQGYLLPAVTRGNRSGPAERPMVRHSWVVIARGNVLVSTFMCFTCTCSCGNKRFRNRSGLHHHTSRDSTISCPRVAQVHRGNILFSDLVAGSLLSIKKAQSSLPFQHASQRLESWRPIWRDPFSVSLSTISPMPKELEWLRENLTQVTSAMKPGQCMI